MRSRRTVRRAVVPLAALGLALSVAACGSSSDKAGDGTDYNKMSLSDLKSAANSEGKVTWYTTFSSDDVDPMIKAFNKDYPNIKVTALRLSADQIPPKVITEQKGHQYTADVISGDSPQVAQLIQAKTLQPYTPPDQTALPAGLKLPEGYEGVVYANTTAVAWNPTVVKKQGLPVPTGVETFTDPAWKGKFSIDPSAVNWYDSLVKMMGHDQALALVKKLGNNDPVFVESHTDALTKVAAGEPAGAATVYGYKAADMAKDTPNQVAFVNPNPLPTSLNLIDVVAHAPHPAAARVFTDWMVSQAGQTEVVDQTNHTTLRPDVKNDPSVFDESKWKAGWGDPMLASSDYNSELAEFAAALHAPQ
ncbi:extracellular solute-binding protein [Nocardioides sp. BP30]|uniref:ABC transporter substrate-binding protein n=1 Tax=Nocardioides sp. BP30 TaxID=3036374 RepID=UPI0024688C38|nr:extracellular solute-binding protein [Nocardioides sp. BP30]WGL52470.1 extracellular solute-binding protein [Nocardioides sp. BP30]